MMRRSNAIVLVTAAVLAVFPAGIALANKAPVDLGGSTWTARNFTEKVTLKKVGHVTRKTTGELDFGPQTVGSTTLTDTDFLLSDGEGNLLTGTWTPDPAGKGVPVLTFDQDPVTALTADLVGQIIQQKYNAQPSNVNIQFSQVNVKDKFSGSGKVILKSTFSAQADVGGQTIAEDGLAELSVSLVSPQAKNGALDLHGTFWYLDKLGVRINVKNIGQYKNETEGSFIFGPQTEPLLQDNEFLLEDNIGHLLPGTWTPDPTGKGKPVLTFDQSAAANVIVGLVTPMIEQKLNTTITNQSVQITDIKVKDKFKDAMSFSGEFGWNFFFQTQGGEEEEETGYMTWVAKGELSQ